MDLVKLLETQTQKKTVGTLAFGKQFSFREVFFEGEDLYVAGEALSGRIHLDKVLIEHVIGRRLTVEKLETILSRTDLTRHLLPQVLHDQGIIDDEELRASAGAHLLEEILDLLCQDAGSFHFQDSRVPEYLLRCEEITTRVPLPIAAILGELRQRKEFLEGCGTVIPSADEVFVVTEKGLALKHEPKTDFVFKRILELMDGFRNLRSIIDDSRFYEFHVLSWIKKALDGGFVKKTIHPELKGVSTHTLSKAEAEKYLPYFKNAVKYGVDELAARERLAVVYERLGKPEDAVIQYNFMGDAFVRMRKSAKAIKAYQRALALKPGEILITDKITKIYRDASEEEVGAGNISQAIQFLQSALRIRPGDREVFSRLFAILIREKKLKELSDLTDGIAAYARKTRSAEVAINACQMVVRELPRHPAFRKKLINLYLDFGMKTEATGEMVTLARQYMERGHVAKAQEMIEKIRRTGSAVEIRGLLKDLEGEKVRIERGPSGKQVVARVAVIVLLLFATYETWTFKLWTAIKSSHVYAEALSEVEGSSQILPGSEESRAARLARDCDSFIHWHPLSFFRADTQRLGFKAKERARELRALRESRVRSVLTQAAVHVREGRKQTVEEMVKPLLKLDPEDPFRIEAEDMLADFRKYAHSAEELLEKGQSLELAEDWKGAYRTYRQILDAYPRSQIAKELRLPVLIQSLPAGVEVMEVAQTGERKPLGRTPHVASLKPESTIAIELAAPGYVPVRAEVQVIDGHERRFVLLRKPSWRLALDGVVEVAPAIHGRLVIAGTQKGALQCLDIEEGKVLWTRPGEAIKSIVVPPIVLEDGVFGVWNNGKLFSLPGEVLTEEGREAPAPPGLEVFLGSLATSPLHPPRGRNLLCVGTKSGHLQAHDRKTLANAWSLPVEGLVAAMDDLDGEDLAVVTHAGWLLRMRIEPLQVIWKRQVTQGEPFEVYPAGKGIVIWTRSADLSILRSSDGVTLLSKDLPEGTAFAMARGSDRLFILHRDGTLSALEPETAAVLKTTNVEAQNAAIHAFSNGVAITRPGRKKFLLVDPATIEPLWEAGLGSEIKTVTGAGKWVLAVTEDGALTAFER